MAESTPRINASLRQSFVDRTIRIVGQLKSVDGDQGVLDASGDVTLQLTAVGNNCTCGVH
jgi:hypothetical protein